MGVVATALLVLAASAGHADAACTVSATGVNFGTYDVYATTPTDSTGTITYRCGITDFDIQITLSPGTSGTYLGRELQQAAGTDRLQYNLYDAASRNTVWGDGTGGTTYYSRHNPPNGRDVVVTIYGRIPAGQDVGVGIYADTIVATINF
jgi:spore coat protein U-like protein